MLVRYVCHGRLLHEVRGRLCGGLAQHLHPAQVHRGLLLLCQLIILLHVQLQYPCPHSDYKLDEVTGLCSFNTNSAESCCLEPEGKKCKQCNRGMSLVDGTCVQTESLGCLEKSVSGECTNCASGTPHLIKTSCWRTGSVSRESGTARSTEMPRGPSVKYASTPTAWQPIYVSRTRS